MSVSRETPPPPPSAAGVFHDQLPLMTQYAAILANEGVERGMIGPREVPRLWDRHLVNSGVVVPRLPAGATVADVGSGAGLPGLVWAIARPDLQVTLIEPLLRRTTFLQEVVDELELINVEVLRARAEDVDRQFEVVTARAVAALEKLAKWCMPLVAPGGVPSSGPGRGMFHVKRGPVSADDKQTPGSSTSLSSVASGAAPASSFTSSEPDQPFDTPLAREARDHVDLARRARSTTQLPRPDQTRIFVVANQKGGVGKTTTAVNVAAALAQKGLRILVVDLDPQGNASTALDIAHTEGTPGVYEALVEDVPLSELVRPAPQLPGITVLPATIDLAGAEIELVSLVARETRLKKALAAHLEERERADDRIDYVVIDCPPSLGLLTVNALVAAREVLIPIQCEYYALEGLGQLVRNIELVRAHLNQDLEITTILLTMYDARQPLRSEGPGHRDPALRPDLRGAELPAVRPHLRPGLVRCALLPRGRPRDRAVRDVRPDHQREGRLMAPRRGLGRGLESLIPSTPAEAKESGLQEVQGARFAELPLDAVVPNPRQPRQVFDEQDMAELVHSIREVGLLQPVVVRETAPGAYELIMGERRWRASRSAGLETIGAIVRDTTDEDLLRDALLENLHRSQLNPLEEAAAYQQLLDDFGCTQEELADRIGRPPRGAGPPRRTRGGRGHLGACARGDREVRRHRRPGHLAVTHPRPHGLRPPPGRPRRPALRALRHPREGRPRQGQGQDHRRVRDDR